MIAWYAVVRQHRLNLLNYSLLQKFMMINLILFLFFCCTTASQVQWGNFLRLPDEIDAINANGGMTGEGHQNHGGSIQSKHSLPQEAPKQNVYADGTLSVELLTEPNKLPKDGRNHGGYMLVSLKIQSESFQYPARYSDFRSLQYKFAIAIRNHLQPFHNPHFTNRPADNFPIPGLRNFCTAWSPAMKRQRALQLDHWLNKMLFSNNYLWRESMKAAFEEWFVSLEDFYQEEGAEFFQNKFSESQFYIPAVDDELQSANQLILGCDFV